LEKKTAIEPRVIFFSNDFRLSAKSLGGIGSYLMEPARIEPQVKLSLCSLQTVTRINYVDQSRSSTGASKDSSTCPTHECKVLRADCLTSGLI